nr:MAG TPA: Sec20 [Caudoviricetes sp.]
MEISSFLAPLQKRSIFLLFVSLLFLLFWIIYRK